MDNQSISLMDKCHVFLFDFSVFHSLEKYTASYIGIEGFSFIGCSFFFLFLEIHLGLLFFNMMQNDSKEKINSL